MSNGEFPQKVSQEKGEMKVRKFLYFSPEIRAFFESVEKATKCPVSRQELINVNDLRFLSYASKICPITYEDIKEDDPEIIIYDSERLLFSKKKINKSVLLPKLNGELIIEGNCIFSFVTIESFRELKEEQGKPTYIINSDGSYQEKTL